MIRRFTDQIGNTITIDIPPQRIVSLVPSQTELLAYFGLDKEVVGITKFCVHPDEWFRTKTRVGGTKNVNCSKIEKLNPDLIICNKEENNESDVRALMEKYPVWTSDIHNLDDALKMITSMGEIVNKKEVGQKLVQQIKENFERFLTPLRSVRNDSIGQAIGEGGVRALPSHPLPFPTYKPVIPNVVRNLAKPLRVLYLIWKNPYMAAGKDTFIDSMLTQCNFVNVCDTSLDRYPRLTTEQLRDLKPQLILLSSEPYPFSEKHLAEFKLYFPGVLSVLVDGEYFSWYGSRLLDAPKYLKRVMENCIKV